MISREEINRMRWAARRGMLELDLLLEPFVDRCYASLDEAYRARFHELMLCEDQQLYAWLMQREAPEEAELALIVDRIIEFTHTSS